MYLDVALLLNFLIDLLLLHAANSLCGYRSSVKRILLSALMGGIYGGLCFLPGFSFLGGHLWRIVSLCIMAWIAYGSGKSIFRRGAVFVLLSMALGGIAVCLPRGGILGILLGGTVVAGLCITGFGGKSAGQKYIPVELNYGGTSLRLTALTDTGNTLRDPITGSPVLVVGANAAMRLLGLTKQQLKEPLKSVISAGVPGLRIIPYRSVGESGGMLLALRLKEVRIGDWHGSSLVAFAPEGLDQEGTYQALTGGVV